MTAALMRGTAPESSPVGQCVAKAARQGSMTAAMLLADAYRQAMAAVARDRPGPAASAPALRFDLFGRHMGWLKLAAQRGDPAAQLLLAQETDGAAYRPMPDTTLAWYQTAAQNGSGPALAAIGAAYSAGRIGDERLYGLKIWLSRQANPPFAVTRLQRLLARPAAGALRS